MRTLGFQVVTQNPLRYRLVVMAALGAADIANNVDHERLDGGARSPCRLYFRATFLRPRLRVALCPLCSIFDPLAPSAEVGISLAASLAARLAHARRTAQLYSLPCRKLH